VILALILAVATPVSGAALILADDGGLDRVTARTLRSLAAQGLRKRGVTVTDDPRFAFVQGVDATLAQVLKETGVQRVFVLRVGGKLGKKVPLAFEEVDPVRLTSIYAADLVATGMDEADRNIARLVESVLDRKPAGDSAAMTTVTAEEKRPFQKKPSERFVALGFPFGFQGSTGRSYGKPFGLSGAFMIEAENARIDFSTLGEVHSSSGTFWVGISANWLPSDRNITPYIGAGVGYLFIGGSDGNGVTRTGGGMGLLAEIGVEAMRLHGFRILAGVQMLVPLYDAKSLTLAMPVTPLVHVRFAF